MKEDQRLHKLFVELKNNDENALEKIYNEYKNVIYKIAFSILKDSNDAEDIVQNVICKIFKMEKSKLPTTKEFSWIYTVTKNEAFTFYRLKNKNDNIDDIYAIKSKINPIDKAEDIIYYNQIIKKLKPIDQEIVSLKIVSDFSFKTISRILNMPIGTVEWRYYKSVKYLKKSVIVSILLVLSLVKLNKNHNEIDNKEKELSQLISMKEEEENNIKDNQVFPGNEYSNVIPNENNTSQNIEMYESMIKDINGDLHQIQTYNILIAGFIIIFMIVIIVNLSKYLKFKKVQKRK